MFKITKVCDFRVNFVLDGFHYSFSQVDGDCGEYWCRLICKEDSSFYVGFGLCSEVWEVLKPYAKDRFHDGMTFKEMFDLKGLEIFLREIVEKG